MARTGLTAAVAAVALLFAGAAAARQAPGPWLRLMTWEGSEVAVEARPPVAVADGLETWILIAWGAPQADAGDYMEGRMRIDCTARQASVMEATSRAADGEILNREVRDAPVWGDGPPGTPVAALIEVLCDGAPVAHGPLHADAGAFVAATRREAASAPPPVPVAPAR